MQPLKLGLTLLMLAITAPAFANSVVNVHLWDKNGDMLDNRLGHGAYFGVAIVWGACFPQSARADVDMIGEMQSRPWR